MLAFRSRAHNLLAVSHRGLIQVVASRAEDHRGLIQVAASRVEDHRGLKRVASSRMEDHRAPLLVAANLNMIFKTFRATGTKLPFPEICPKFLGGQCNWCLKEIFKI